MRRAVTRIDAAARVGSAVRIARAAEAEGMTIVAESAAGEPDADHLAVAEETYLFPGIGLARASTPTWPGSPDAQGRRVNAD